MLNVLEEELNLKKKKKVVDEDKEREHQLKALLDKNYLIELAAKQARAKEIRVFNKRLTAKKLYEADIQLDPDFNEKVAKCFEIRTKKMVQNQVKQRQKWEDAISKDKKYNQYKKGYKFMLNDHTKAK